jgi:hypothetical protein
MKPMRAATCYRVSKEVDSGALRAGADLAVVGNDEPALLSCYRQPLFVRDIVGELILQPDNVFAHPPDRLSDSSQNRAVYEDHAASGIS